MFIGAILWLAVLKSGVHATLAGVVLALFIPTDRTSPKDAPAAVLENSLHGFCFFMVLPIFAFANSGLSFGGQSLFDSIMHTVPLGIALGLPFGNFVGIMLCVFIGVRVFGLSLPEGSSWVHMAGVAFLCGIGFTMSLFIGSLAFSQGGPAYDFDERLGILAGSILSAAVGLIILRLAPSRPQ